LAVFGACGTVNAYVAGMARVYSAAARDGVFPKTLAVVDRRTGVPHHSLVFLIILVLLSLSAFYVLNVDFVSAFLMASGAAVFTYVIGSAAGIRLLKERGWRRALPWISLAVSVALLPFIGTLLVASVVIAGAGLLARREVLPRLDVPLVLEHARRLPDEDLPRRVDLSRSRQVLDASSFARFDACLGQVPSREVLRFRDRFPHELYRMPYASFEREGRVVTLECEGAQSRGGGCSHSDPFSVRFLG